MQTQYHGPEIIRASGKTQLAFVVPVRSSERLVSAVLIAQRVVAEAKRSGDIVVSPNEAQAAERHAHPGLCVYIAVPESVSDPLSIEMCEKATAIVNNISAAIAA